MIEDAAFLDVQTTLGVPIKAVVKVVETEHETPPEAMVQLLAPCSIWRSVDPTVELLLVAIQSKFSVVELVNWYGT